MTTSHHHDHRETTASPQTLIRDLRAQDGALPDALCQRYWAAGAAMVPSLIARLEAGLADDQAEPEGVLFQAVDLLGALGEARAVPILLRCLEHDDLFDGMAPPAAAALRALGPAALEGCLAAYATATEDAFRDRLAGVLSRCGVHDERLYACLVETLQRTPELGANYLTVYGEARALDVLARTFDTLPLRDEASPLANHVFIELRAAMEDLGGQLTAAQHQKFAAADAARRRFVAQMHWDTDPARRACLAHTPAGDVSRGHTSSPPLRDPKARPECPLLVWEWPEVQEMSSLARIALAGAHGWPPPLGSKASRHGSSASGSASSLVCQPLWTPGAEVVTSPDSGLTKY